MNTNNINCCVVENDNFQLIIIPKDSSLLEGNPLLPEFLREVADGYDSESLISDDNSLIQDYRFAIGRDDAPYGSFEHGPFMNLNQVHQVRPEEGRMIYLTTETHLVQVGSYNYLDPSKWRSTLPDTDGEYIVVLPDGVPESIRGMSKIKVNGLPYECTRPLNLYSALSIPPENYALIGYMRNGNFIELFRGCKGSINSTWIECC